MRVLILERCEAKEKQREEQEEEKKKSEEAESCTCQLEPIGEIEQSPLPSRLADREPPGAVNEIILENSVEFVLFCCLHRCQARRSHPIPLCLLMLCSFNKITHKRYTMLSLRPNRFSPYSKGINIGFSMAQLELKRIELCKCCTNKLLYSNASQCDVIL